MGTGEAVCFFCEGGWHPEACRPESTTYPASQKPYPGGGVRNQSSIRKLVLTSTFRTAENPYRSFETSFYAKCFPFNGVKPDCIGHDFAKLGNAMRLQVIKTLHEH